MTARERAEASPHRWSGRPAMRASVLVAVALLGAACSTTRHPAGVTTTTTSAPPVGVSNGGTASTTAPPQTSGVRTVLSPVGLNLRAQASKTAAVLGTAAQGATVTVLGHVDQGSDGWYQVKGATVTGYVSDKSTLSAPGNFLAYGSSQLQFSALYPEKWTVTEAPPTSVVFRPPTGGDSIVVTTAASVAVLGRGRSGYRQIHDEQIVVCGVTGDLLTFEQPASAPGTATPATPATPTSTAGAGAPAGPVAPERYLAQIHITLDAQHALGVDANLADTSQLQKLRDFADSISFDFPQCVGATAVTTTATTAAH